MFAEVMAQAGQSLPFREVYWNVLSPHLKVYIPLAIMLVAFGYGVWRRFAMWRMGKKDKRTDNIVGRAFWAGWDLGSQRLVMRELVPGLIHAMLFFGFVILFIGTLIIMLEADLGIPVLSTPSYFYWAYTITLNLYGLLAIGGVVFLALRRYVLRPKELDNKHDDWFALFLLFAILVTGHLLQALRLAEQQPWWAAYSFVSYGFAKVMFWGLDSAALKTAHSVVWWVHFLLVLFFFAYLPFGKLWHIVAGSFSLFFRSSSSRGRMAKDEAVAAMMNGEDTDVETFGVAKLEELSWKQLLDSDACIRCGRCQENCPAYLTGKQLNPKQVIQDIKGHMEDVFGRRKKKDENGEDGRPSLQGEIISQEVLWACTTCRACEANCPMGIEHLDVILPMRQYLTQMETAFPQEVTSVFKGMENNNNPWQIGSNKRFDWAEDLDLKALAEDPEHEILFFVGCAGAFDDRAQKVTKAFIRLMQAAKVNFGLLGIEEGCCGETARRMGNEYLAQTLIMQNVETMNKYKVKRIVTTCPHGYNTLKNEYKDFGGDYEVLHHTELLAELIRDGRLQLSGDGMGKVAFHDSCYLGRYNDVFAAPRKALKAVPGLELVEAERSGRKAFCCGAGGGRMWMEENEGTRINNERTDQLLETGAKTVAVGCPYCLTMLTDGLKDKDLVDTHKILDVAEIMARYLPQEVKPAPVEEPKAPAQA
ncbi:MAG: 4Fe-4S dicluster domain-containing protein [Deltaproteobacteria bacterium]|nr:4Fe-4S dicluster domain-containing protein [Deltaproteobacteria bacterium]